MQCYYCKKYFQRKGQAMDHLERMHADELVRDGISSAQACYLTTHPDIHGRCVVCGKPTAWCDRAGKPHRICGSQACKNKLAEAYNRNRDAALGMSQHDLMSNMDHQQEMLNSRRIHGVYKFSDGGAIDYIGKLEKNFLWFLDTVMDFKSTEILPSPEVFTYKDTREGVDRQYVPDYYLINYNLLVEIKDGGEKVNTNPAFLETTRYKVAMKDKAMREQTKYNYIRIGGTNYGPFMETLYKITHNDDADKSKASKNVVIISESAGAIKPEDTQATIDRGPAILIVMYSSDTSRPTAVAIGRSGEMGSLELSDMEDGALSRVSYDDPRLSDGERRVYRHIGDPSGISDAMDAMGSGEAWFIPDILRSFGIHFTDGETIGVDDAPECDFVPMANDNDEEGDEDE